jgi:hypothetical protein
MKQSEILHEFLVLNTWTPGIKSKSIKDRYLDNRCLLREYNNKITMYFLDSGQTLIIPRDYIQIMRSLDVGSGERLHYNEVSDPDRLDLFISGLAKAVKLLDTTTGLSEDLKDIFLGLARLGTHEFRDFLRNHEVSLKPWSYEEPGKTLEL